MANRNIERQTRPPEKTGATMTSAMDRAPDSTIVLIHGLWMTPLSWENWIRRYEHAGHRVLAPA